MLLLRVADQVVVHELAPVIRMDAQEREREVAANAAQCSGDMFLTLVPYCLGLGPARPDVGDVQRAGILSSTDTAFMRHQEGSDESWLGTIPFSSSLERDPAQGKYAGTGARMLQPVTGGGLMWRRRSRRAGARSSCPRVSRKGKMRRRNGVEMRQVHELIQDPRLLVLRCMEILSLQLLHDSLSLLHR